MDLREALSGAQRKEAARRIVAYVGNDRSRFRELIRIFLKSGKRMEQCAGWPLGDIAYNLPELLRPYYPDLLRKLEEKDNHPSVRRNILRAMQKADIPEKYCAAVFDFCLSVITSETEPIAVRAFAITVGANICKRFPDLAGEFRPVLEQLRQLGTTAAIAVRIREALKILPLSGT
jgi:hypothetical protein